MIDWSVPIPALLAIFGGLLALGAAFDIMRRANSKGGRASRQLMDEAGLTSGERRLLRRMARKAKLPNAGCLIISRGCFEDAARICREGGLSSRELDDLHHRLFKLSDIAEDVRRERAA